MKRISKCVWLVTVIFFLGALTLTSVNAVDCVKKIIVFNEDVTQEQIKDYILTWQEFGLIPVSEVEFINAYIVCVPDSITNEKLAADNRVIAVEEDQEIGSQSSAKITYVAPDEVVEEIEEVDEGIEDELQASGFRKIKRFIRVFNNFSFSSSLSRPWGMLSLLGLPYNKNTYSSVVTGRQLFTDNVKLAKQKLSMKKIKIAVFDTGIDNNNPIFGNSIKGGKDFINFIDEIPMDINGHGSHVAASIVGQETGLAEGCDLYAVKILDDDATGRISTLILAFQWAIKKKIDIINMSIAFRQNNFVVHLAVKKAYRAGIILVAAVGNHSNWLDESEAAGASVDWGYAAGNSGVVIDVDGDSTESEVNENVEENLTETQLIENVEENLTETQLSSNTDTSNTEESTDEEIQGVADGGASAFGISSSIPFPVMYPAKYPEVIAVGAHDSSGRMAQFSNYGRELDITAPGVGIVSANIKSISKYGICNGTSMAAPHVAAALGLMKALDRRNRLTPSKAKSILKRTAQGGKLNLKGALAEVLKL